MHKLNLFSTYEQFNHLHAPKYFDWVKDGSGSINIFVDDYIRLSGNYPDLPKVAILIEPRTIQPTIYQWVEEHNTDFDLIFSHDESILKFVNAYPIYFMQWYKTYDVPKTKPISMVCSDKVLCNEHRQRQRLADILGNKVDHYGMYKGGSYCDYYECRAEYMFEVVIDNNWSGYWLSEKLANPLACKTVPIYLGGKYFPGDINTNGIIIAESIKDIPSIIDEILKNPYEEYDKRYESILANFINIKTNYQVFEDWFWLRYSYKLKELIDE